MVKRDGTSRGSGEDRRERGMAWPEGEEGMMYIARKRRGILWCSQKQQMGE